jgi:transglutaminase-like putative cysteine protease
MRATSTAKQATTSARVADAQSHGAIASVLSRYFEASLYLMLYTAVLTLVATGKLDLFTTIVAPTVLVWKGFRRWRGSGPEFSQRTATYFIAAYFLFAPVDYILARNRASDAPNPALYAALLSTVHMLLFAMMVRLYSARTRRDSLFLAMIAFACMLAAAVLTVDTAYLAFFLVFLTLGISTFVALEMERGAENASAAPIIPGSPQARTLVRALGVVSGTVALAALVLGGLLFFTLPRFTAGYLGSYSMRPQLMTGFSENVELGQIGQIQKSSEVVMRVKVEGGPARFANQHWRGIALVRFDGRRWSSLAMDRKRLYQDENGWFLFPDGRPIQRSQILNYKVLLEPVASDAVFVAGGASAIRGRFSVGSGLGDGTRRNFLLTDSASSIFNPYPNYSELSYEASSMPPTATPEQLRAAGSKYPPEIRMRYLQMPALDPRVAELARQATAAAANPYDKAVALQSYLQTRYNYTLDQGSISANDPLANFLFVRKAGHCEYFATAMTIMLRTLGIPARYINGFQTGEYNDVGGDFIVRASDAHSWVEAYFPGRGWITFDPTPAGEASSRGWFASFAKYMDWIQYQWGEWIINYDFLHQVSLSQGVGRASRQWANGARERVTHSYDALVNRMKQWQTDAAASRWAPEIIGLAIAAIIGLFAGKPLTKYFRRKWTLSAAGKHSLTPQRASAHYSEMLRLLARRGFTKAEWITPMEFAASIPQPELAAPVGRLTEIYQAARFGEVAVEPRQSVELLREIRACITTLKPQRQS